MFTRRLVLTGLGATSIAALVPGALRAAPIKPNEASALLVIDVRSEEHTSELQSQSNLVCRLLLEKKKTGLNGFTFGGFGRLQPAGQRRGWSGTLKGLTGCERVVLAGSMLSSPRTACAARSTDSMY